jgi:homoserine kinase
MVLVRDNESLDIKKLHIPPGIHIAVIHPHVQVLTRDSREVLSDSVPLDMVIKQSGNLAAFVAAMYTSDIDLLGRCIKDVIIEPQRAQLIPHFYDLKEVALNEGALGFSISGAGPAMFAMCANSLIAENVVIKTQSILKTHRIENTAFTSHINNEGAIIY